MILSGLIYMGAALTAFVVALRALELLFATPSNRLKLTIFRTYRGNDPWPQGVQEEDTVRFDLSPRTPSPAPIAPSWDDIVVSGPGDRGSNAGVDAVGEARIEETANESAVVEPLHSEVHRLH